MKIFLKNLAVVAAVFLALWNLDERVLFSYDAGLSWVWPIWECAVFVLTFGGFVWANWQMFPQIKQRIGRTFLRLAFSLLFTAGMLMIMGMARFERDEEALWEAMFEEGARLFPDQFQKRPDGTVEIVRKEPNQGLESIGTNAPNSQP